MLQKSSSLCQNIENTLLSTESIYHSGYKLSKTLDRSLTFAESLTASSTRFVYQKYLAWMAEQLQLFSVIFLALDYKQKFILKLKAEFFKLRAEIETFKNNKNGRRVWRLYSCVFNKNAEKKAIKSFKKALFFFSQIHCNVNILLREHVSTYALWLLPSADRDAQLHTIKSLK